MAEFKDSVSESEVAAAIAQTKSELGKTSLLTGLAPGLFASAPSSKRSRFVDSVHAIAEVVQRQVTVLTRDRLAARVKAKRGETRLCHTNQICSRRVQANCTPVNHGRPRRVAANANCLSAGV